MSLGVLWTESERGVSDMKTRLEVGVEIVPKTS